jgi:hypothetical protein
MRLWRGSPPPQPCGVEVGALYVPMAGEDECGDGWAASCDLDGATCSGSTAWARTGSGQGARAAVHALERRPSWRRPRCCTRRTRRCASRAARRCRWRASTTGSNELRFAGIGNVNCVVHDGAARGARWSRTTASSAQHAQGAGVHADCPPGALVILHSDGIQTQWDLGDYPGLHARAGAGGGHPDARLHPPPRRRAGAGRPAPGRTRMSISAFSTSAWASEQDVVLVRQRARQVSACSAFRSRTRCASPPPCRKWRAAPASWQGRRPRRPSSQRGGGPRQCLEMTIAAAARRPAEACRTTPWSPRTA